VGALPFTGTVCMEQLSNHLPLKQGWKKTNKT